ncbi:hypothetical protein, partial [Paraburkholderia caribensis]|uniref:hypothetical protein n=1 Tax=Paraburkholderia caribensis TaxID=75105 RepID=UPI003F493142
MASDSPNKSFINVDVVFLGVGAAFCAVVWFFLSATLCLAMRSWVAFVVYVALVGVFGLCAGIRVTLARFKRRPCAGRHLLFFAAAKKSRQK